MTQISQQFYPTNPHLLMTYNDSLDIESPADVNLDAELQFVGDGGVAKYDFSAFVYVVKDGSNLEAERKRISDEIHAFDNLVKAVQEAHASFVGNAMRALDEMKNFVPEP